MAVPDRFQPSSEGQEESAVRVTPGTDRHTSLPVLIYEFEGESPAPRADLENLPDIVESGFEEGRGWAVTSLPPGTRRWSQSEGPFSPAQLLSAVRAFREAAESELVHGDIRPERLLLVHDDKSAPPPGRRVTIEGFGIPWKPDRNPFTAPESDGTATPAADVWALATVLQTTGFEPDDATVQAVLEQCRAADPELRPTAEELAEALEQLIGPSSSDPEEDSGRTEVAAFEETAVPEEASGRAEAAGAGEPSDPEETSGPEEGVVAGSSEDAFAQEDEAAAEVPAGFWTERVTTSNDDRTGESQPPRAERPVVTGRLSPTPSPLDNDAAEAAETAGGNRNRPVLLAGLMAAVVILALLSFFWPGGSNAPANVTREATIYVVEVTVSPDDLPPVTVHLVSAPAGSSLAGGDRLGTAPRHLALDRAGTWAFRGSLGGRVSETIEIQVPDERSLELTIPPEASGE